MQRKLSILENFIYNLLNTHEKRDKKKTRRYWKSHIGGWISNESSRKMEQENAGKEITREITEENFPDFN